MTEETEDKIKRMKIMKEKDILLFKTNPGSNARLPCIQPEDFIYNWMTDVVVWKQLIGCTDQLSIEENLCFTSG
jgi:hypothetical protein